MAKYYGKVTLDSLYEYAKNIVAARNEALAISGIDLLDTDAISSLSIYAIVKQYDPDYNINFARNGEDAKSNGILIEQKTTRVSGLLTKTGRPRKGAGSDAAFQFHAMGDLDYPRYIFAAKSKDDLSILRLYDISSESNQKLVLNHLMHERQAWLDRAQQDKKLMKRDIIILPEKFILDNLALTAKFNIGNCVILKDS
jgi:hypothetical protein